MSCQERYRTVLPADGEFESFVVNSFNHDNCQEGQCFCNDIRNHTTYNIPYRKHICTEAANIVNDSNADHNSVRNNTALSVPLLINKSAERVPVCNGVTEEGVQEVHECLIETRVNCRAILALIDSGATHSIVGKTFFHKLPHFKKKLVYFRNEVNATAINGSKVSYPAFIDFDIDIEGTKFAVHALYSREVSYDVVLGFDFLSSHSFTIDFKQIAEKRSPSSFIRLTDDIKVQPMTETTVWGNVESTLLSGDGLISCCSSLPELELFVAASVISVTDKTYRVPVTMMNPSNHQKSLKRNTIVANIRLLQPDEHIHEMHDEPTTISSPEMMKQCSTDVCANIPENFKSLFDLSTSAFSDDQREQLMNLLWEYEDVFAQPGKPLGRTDVMEFHIDLKEDAVPFKARPYRSNPRVREEISRQVKEMLDQDIIEPSTSQFGSPVLLVTKSDGSYRFCIDYRKLNSMTKIDCHPLNRTDDSLESLGAAKAKFFQV